MRRSFIITLAALIVFCLQLQPVLAKPKMSLIRPSADGTHFVCVDGNSRFTPWGLGYEHDNDGLIAGQQWKKHFPTVIEDFKIMKSLGANVIRIHLQTCKYMPTPTEPNQSALDELTDLIKLAQDTGLYLDITGLACYRKNLVPKWYADANETLRWAVQARFWEAIAERCKDTNTVMFFSLMNEPTIPLGKPITDMLAEPLGDRSYVQNITLDPAGRDAAQIARAWVETLVTAIKKHDKRHMITIGEIPWSQTWPTWRSPFHSPQVAKYLDFVSIHMYPKTNEVDKAILAVDAYKVGKPIIVEELFPLACSAEEMEVFMDETKDIVDGWVSFYWRNRDVYSNELVIRWAKRMQTIRPDIVDSNTLSCR